MCRFDLILESINKGRGTLQRPGVDVDRSDSGRRLDAVCQCTFEGSDISTDAITQTSLIC